MIKRVLNETQAVLATCNNAGSFFLSEGDFEPTIIIYEDAVEISVASFCVPLACFDLWQGIFLFGDTYQFVPHVLEDQKLSFLITRVCLH